MILKICFEIYQLDPAKFCSAPGLAWQTGFKKTKLELELLTDVDILLMVEKEVRGGICHSINRYAKVDDKYMKDFDKNKESSYLKCCDVNNLYVWAMSQKLTVNGFKWTEYFSKFDEGFMKNCNEKSKEGYFLKDDIQYPENLHNAQNDLPFLPERIKIEKV